MARAWWSSWDVLIRCFGAGDLARGFAGLLAAGFLAARAGDLALGLAGLLAAGFLGGMLVFVRALTLSRNGLGALGAR